MSDAPGADRRPSVDSGAIELTSEPIVLDRAASRAGEPVDVTPAPDGNASEPANRPSRRRTIVLGTVLAVALAGAGALGSASWPILREKDATLTSPDEVAGLTRDDSDGARTTIEYLRTAVNAEVDFAKSFGAAYADPAAPDRSVLLFGGTRLVWQPERDLDLLFALAAEEDSPVGDVREVDAGVFGGIMKCGTAPMPDGALVFCGWADHGSVAMGMFPGRGVDESAALLRDIRDVVQTRN